MVFPSMLTVGSPCSLDWLSFLEGLWTGGRLSTMFDGVIELFRVSAHWLATLRSTGAFFATVPSKRTCTCGFVPAFQCSATYLFEYVMVNLCAAVSHATV